MKKLMYIFLLLIMVAQVAAQESYVIDSVCAGSDRTYRINGEKGSTFEWHLTDILGTELPVDNAEGILFKEKDPISGDSIYGGEINIIWDDPGEFILSTYHYSEHGCDTVEQGIVKVYEAPLVFAGNQQVICAGNTVRLNDATAQNYSSLRWTTTGDGSFTDDTQLNAEYVPGTNDSITGNVMLILTASGLAENTTCIPAKDTVEILLNFPKITFNTTDLTCYGQNTGEITATATGGAEPYSFNWTGPNGFTATGNEITNLIAGKYFVTVTDFINCIATDSIEITEPEELLVTVTSDPAEMCEGGSILFSANVSGGTGIYIHQWSGNGAGYLNSTDVAGPEFSGAPAGNYELTYTVRDEQNCEATEIFNIVVKAPLESTTDSTVCESETPITWNGQLLDATGTYTATFTSSNNCDSVATLNLTVIPALTSTTDSTVCESETPITWNGQPLDVTGTYTATFTSSNNCDSVATLNLTVIPALTSTTDSTVCESETPITWNGQLLDVTGTYTASFTSSNNCDSVATLNLTVIPALTSTTDSTVCESETPITWNGQLLDATGTYTASFTSSNNCDSVATLNLTVIPALTSTTDSTVCESETPITWNGQLLDATGTYTATFTSSNNCDSVVTLNLTVLPALTSTTDSTVCESETPITWNGQLLDATGTYTATFTSSNNCDSVATLNLTVIPALTSTTDSTVCESETPITWNGQLLDATGTYTATFTSSNNCDSVATLNLTVIQALTSTTDSTVCESETPITWNGQLLDATGTYTATFTSSNNCDSVATLNLTVIPALTSTTDSTVCESETPITWNGQLLDVTGTYTATFTSSNNCDSVATLNLTVIPALTSTTDSTVCESETPITWNGQLLDATGTYTATFTSSNNCDSVATLNLTVIPALTSTTDSTVCESETPITWNGQLLDATGTYTATFISSQNCDSVATLNLTVIPEITETKDTVVCENALPFIWNDELFTKADTIIQIIPSSSGGCDIIRTLQLRVTPLAIVTVSITANTIQVEEGQPVTFTAVSDNEGANPIYAWFINDTEIIGETSFTYTYTPQDNDEVYVTLISDFECAIPVPAISNTVTVTVEQPVRELNVLANIIPVLCYEETTGAIKLTVTGGSGNYTYVWSNEETTKDIYNLPAGEYTVAISDSKGNSEQISIEIAQPEELKLTYTKVDVDESNEPIGSIDLNVSGGTAPFNFEWTGPDGFSSTTEDIANLFTGNYSVWVTDANGCQQLLTLSINGYGMSCPPPIVLNCGIDEIPEPYQSREEYESAGGTIQSSVPLIDATFKALPDVSNGNACPEVITRTYSIENANGDLITCDQLIIIRDVIKPELIFSRKSVNCPEDVPPIYHNRSDFENYRGEEDYAYDECGLDWSTFSFITESIDDQKCPETIIRFYEIKDLCGNRTQAREIIAVDDRNRPIIYLTPGDIVTDCDIPAPYTGREDFEEAGGFIMENCGNYTFEYIKDSVVNSGCPKIINRLYRITDYCDNYVIYTQKITINDNILPEITCPPTVSTNASTEDLENLTGLPISDITLQVDLADTSAIGLKVSDNCKVETITYKDQITGYCPLHIERTFTVYDVCGNQQSCTQIIELTGTETPLFKDIGPLCYNTTPPLLPNTSVNGITGTWSPSVISTAEIGETTYRFTPGNGQCAEQVTIVIEILEEIRPQFDPIAPICLNSAPPVLPSVSNNGISGTWTPNTIPTGSVNTQTYVFTPDSGVCIVPFTMEIEVVDEIKPIFVPIGPLCLNSTPPELPTTSLNGIIGTWAPGIIQTANLGVTPYTFIPGPGQCGTPVTMDIEIIEPVALCRDTTLYLDANGDGEIYPGMISQLILNDCAIDTVYLSKYNFDCSDVGVNQVTLTLGNSESILTECTSTVTVWDTISPFINCHDTTIQLDENAQHTLTAEEVTTIFDACGIDDLQLSQTEFDCDDIGTNLIEIIATDANGNISRCISSVTILGNIAPLARPDTIYTMKNEPVSIDVANNDFDILPDFTKNIRFSKVTAQSSPSHGKAEIAPSTSVFLYTPEPDFTGEDLFIYEICDDGIPCEPMCAASSVVIYVREPNTPPVANDDNYDVMCFMLQDNFMDNDTDNEGNILHASTEPVVSVRHGELVINADGSFNYLPDRDYNGIDSFVYEICDDGIPSMCDTATVYINIIPDNDCDGISDFDDIDDDNDGILDVTEGDRTYDTDGDGIFNSLDIDSDNDGIPDNIEWQTETGYIPPTGNDSNGNGWDDAYDTDSNGTYYQPVDTDNDGTPDYLDLDADGDGVWDYIEGHDVNADGIADEIRLYTDSDGDGLDDAYDTYDNHTAPSSPNNETGSNAPLQDFDGDGIRDWRDVNDDGDELLTLDEDWNNDGDYSNDDMDLDGHPDYLDIETDCVLFIPEGFSPNDDGVHDFFQIFCIQRYPDAKLMIFNRAGNKLFEKEHYGNMNYWGSDQNAWWWGTSENKWTLGTGTLPAGTYVYILQLGTGEERTGTVMISY